MQKGLDDRRFCMGVIQNIIFPKRSSKSREIPASRHSPSEDTVATTNVTMFSQLNMKWWQLNRCLADEAPWGSMGFLVSKWRILSGHKSVDFFISKKSWFVPFCPLKMTRNIIFITKVVRYFHDIDVFDPTPWSPSVPGTTERTSTKTKGLGVWYTHMFHPGTWWYKFRDLGYSPKGGPQIFHLISATWRKCTCWFLLAVWWRLDSWEWNWSNVSHVLTFQTPLFGYLKSEHLQ